MNCPVSRPKGGLAGGSARYQEIVRKVTITAGKKTVLKETMTAERHYLRWAGFDDECGLLK